MQGETGRLRVVAREEIERPTTPSTDAPSPGRFLREQRKRRGMSIEQLASATKIPRASLELLEDDRYEGLPGPVFVKGFLRCAARALGVEVQTVMDLLYERERAALAARKGAKPALPTPPLPTARAAARGGEEPTPGRAAPRVRAQRGPSAKPLVARLRRSLPSPAVFLWVLVAAFVAMVVLAAFNLVGGGHSPQS